MGHNARHRELTYLIEDLTKDLNKLSESGELEYYDKELIAQVHQKLEILEPMQIGTTDVLDSIQYLLGEIRTGRYQDDEVHLQVDRMIDYIQDYLDFVSVTVPKPSSSGFCS
jgi:hypothetical protein